MTINIKPLQALVHMGQLMEATAPVMVQLQQRLVAIQNLVERQGARDKVADEIWQQAQLGAEEIEVWLLLSAGPVDG